MTEPIVEYRNRFEAGNFQRDRVRNVPLKVAEIQVNTSGLVLEGECLYPGTYRIPVYKDRVDAINALVEPFPEKVVEAKALFAKDKERADASGSKGIYLSWVHAYKMITGGLEPQPLASCKWIDELPPPQSDDEQKAVATMKALVETAMRVQGQASSKK